MAENENEVERETEPQDAPQQVAQEQAESQPTAEGDDLPPVQVDVQDLGALRRKLVITVPAERIAAKRGESLKQLSDSAQVPGFRIGRAPRRLIEKRFGTEMKHDIKLAMIGWGYTQALEKAELKVLGEPPMDDDKLNSIELPEDGPMTFDVEVEVQPEFELPELANIPVTRPSAEVTDADLEQALGRWQANFATTETVDGPAEPDDLLSTDLVFEVEGGEKHEHPGHTVAVRPQALEGVPLEDLGEKLTGATAGQTVTVETTMPEGHPKTELRGKKAIFTFNVRQVKRTKLPELNDEFVKKMGFDSADEFRNWVRERLEAESAVRQRQMMHQQVADYLLEKVQLELPEGALAQLRDRTMTRRANDLMMQGVPRTEIEKHIDKLAVHAGEEAARELKMLFIMQKVADKLEVQVTEQEVNSLIAQLAAQYNRRPDNLRDELQKRDGIGSLVAQIRERKAIDLVLEQAAIEDAGKQAENADQPEKKQEGDEKQDSQE